MCFAKHLYITSFIDKGVKHMSFYNENTKTTKICIIAEGSYPYITGGVSSWIQMLISGLSQYKFIIFSIGPKESGRRMFNYKIPENVIEIKEIFLDEINKRRPRNGKRLGINKSEKKAWENLLIGDNPDWDILFSFIKENKLKNIHTFLASKDFFDILEFAYNKKYSNMPFANYYWTFRSLIHPLLIIINQDIPKADIYHSVSAGYGGIVGSLAKFIYNKPFILTEHGIYTREREEEIIKSDWIISSFKNIWIEHFYSLSKCAYDHADKVITLFDKNKEIQMELGCNEKKIEVIPNGIEINLYSNLIKTIPKDDYINVGAIVRIVPIKDIKTMIEGFGIAKKKYDKIRLYIMGPFEEDIEYYRECRLLADNLCIKDIIFTGKVNITDYIGQMDILLLSSISEGQPLSILEGMASSKPFIATNVGSCKDLLYGNGDSYGYAGLVIPIMGSYELGKSIIELCKNKELRTDMGNNALRRVTDLYSKDRLISSYNRVYRQYGGE